MRVDPVRPAVGASSRCGSPKRTPGNGSRQTSSRTFRLRSSRTGPTTQSTRLSPSRPTNPGPPADCPGGLPTTHARAPQSAGDSSALGTVVPALASCPETTTELTAHSPVQLLSSWGYVAGLGTARPPADWG